MLAQVLQAGDVLKGTQSGAVVAVGGIERLGEDVLGDSFAIKAKQQEHDQRRQNLIKQVGCSCGEFEFDISADKCLHVAAYLISSDAHKQISKK